MKWSKLGHIDNNWSFLKFKFMSRKPELKMVQDSRLEKDERLEKK